MAMLKKITRLYALAASELGRTPNGMLADGAICLAALIVSVAAAAFAILLDGQQP